MCCDFLCDFGGCWSLQCRMQPGLLMKILQVQLPDVVGYCTGRHRQLDDTCEFTAGVS